MFNYVIWILVSVLYAPVFSTLYQIRWDSVDYTHAYFILPIALWLTWRKRKIIRNIYHNNTTDGRNILSLFLAVLGILMYLFGGWQDYVFIQSFSLIPTLFGLTGFLYGKEVSRTLIFPIFYLLLLVPPPFGLLDSITLPMRHGVSAVTESALRLMDYPITREGLLLTIGYQDIFMGAPCSGFRSLITMFSLVLVYVYISKGNLAKKIILTSFIVPMALFGNLVRVITLCLITFYFGEKAGQGFFHNFSGIVIFTITILGLLAIEYILDMKHAKA